MTSIEALYDVHPELYSAEHEAEHRVERRLGILDLVQPGTVGAELGVFTGLFAEAILEKVRPSTRSRSSLCCSKSCAPVGSCSATTGFRIRTTPITASSGRSTSSSARASGT